MTILKSTACAAFIALIASTAMARAETSPIPPARGNVTEGRSVSHGPTCCNPAADAHTAPLPAGTFVGMPLQHNDLGYDQYERRN